MEVVVLKWDYLRSVEMTSQNKAQLPTRRVPHLSDSPFHPASLKATDPEALLVHTDFVLIINPRNAQERGREAY